VVWPLEIPGIAAVESHRGQLDDCLRGVLFSGAGEPHRIVSIFDGAAEDHSRGHYPVGVFGFFRALSERTVSVELRRRFHVPRWRSLFHVL